MNNLILSYDAVTTQNGQPVTTSLEVAKYFGKNHLHVLRDIKEIWQSKSGLPDSISRLKSGETNQQILDFCRRNFKESTYQDRGKNYPMYYLTKDGFTFLVMGYTGEKAKLFKIAYINAFNQMSATLREAETHFTRKAKAALREKYPQWEPIQQRFKLSNQTVKRIASELGVSESTVRRSLKGGLHWGLMTDQEYQSNQQLHREFQAALRQVLAERQLSLGEETDDASASPQH